MKKRPLKPAGKQLREQIMQSMIGSFRLEGISIDPEKAAELLEVINLGSEVFGDIEKFSRWFHAPSYVLGDVRPMELVRAPGGKKQVIAELTRMEHGILG